MPGNWQEVALGGVLGARWCWSTGGVTSPSIAEAGSGLGGVVKVTVTQYHGRYQETRTQTLLFLILCVTTRNPGQTHLRACEC